MKSAMLCEYYVESKVTTWKSESMRKQILIIIFSICTYAVLAQNYAEVRKIGITAPFISPHWSSSGRPHVPGGRTHIFDEKVRKAKRENQFWMTIWESYYQEWAWSEGSQVVDYPHRKNDAYYWRFHLRGQKVNRARSSSFLQWDGFFYRTGTGQDTRFRRQWYRLIWGSVGRWDGVSRCTPS